MAGRAGRRGIDKRGHVIFFGMRGDKLQRLMRSALPHIVGNLVLNNSLALRLIMRQSVVRSLLDERSDSLPRDIEQRFANGVARLIECPLFQTGLMQKQALHTFRFCTEFLFRSKLLTRDADGEIAANDSGALVAHLFFLEPANFAVHQLMQVDTDFVRSLASPGKEEELVALLANLFHEEPLPLHFTRLEGAGGSSSPTSPSVVKLPPLDPHAATVLSKSRDEALKILRDYFECFVRAHFDELGFDDTLPLSGVSFNSEDRERGEKENCGEESGHLNTSSFLSEYTMCHIVRSNFVALSGYDDDFGSVSEFCATTRLGLYIDPKVYRFRNCRG
jgi:hypothetical protein